MKYGILVHKLKAWKTAFDPDYLDETSELKKYADQVREQKQGIKKPKVVLDALDYIDKEKLGKVYAAGFIRDMASVNPDKSRSHFESLDNDERKSRISKAWRKHAAKFSKLKKTHHRLVFSMSKEFHAKLVEKGINPEIVLQSVMKRSLQNFTDKYHSGDSLGYCYGIHHDTDNLHMHVMVHTRTRDGKQTSFSQQLKGRKDDGRDNKLEFLKKSVDTQWRAWDRKIDDPKQLEALRMKNLESEKIFFAPHYREKKAADPLTPPVTGLKIKRSDLEAKRAEIQNLERQINDLKTQFREERFDKKVTNRLGRAFGYRPGHMEKAFAKVVQEISFSQIRELQKKRSQLHESYLRSWTSYNKDRAYRPINPVIMRKFNYGTKQQATVSRNTAQKPNPITATAPNLNTTGTRKQRG
ncbi:MAG: hypothetical protein V4507_10725 [Verrucomicrobiota bacterium]